MLRTLLILGRVSNLPTVWSNCLAGWWLGGGENFAKLPYLFVGVTLLYVAGMFLNDALDSDFDHSNRRERPIPSGAISARTVWRLGFALLILGSGLLFVASKWTGILGAVLVFLILLYDAIHKATMLAPVIMGSCRTMVYLVAASVGIFGENLLTTGEMGTAAEIAQWNPGHAVWGAVVLGLYVVGLSYVARRESFSGRPVRWPLLLLATPIVLALIVNAGTYRETAALLALIPAVWILRSLRPAYFMPMPNVGRTVSGLLAGIVFVDWLAVADAARELGPIFIGLFLLSLLGQRYIPAT